MSLKKLTKMIDLGFLDDETFNEFVTQAKRQGLISGDWDSFHRQGASLRSCLSDLSDWMGRIVEFSVVKKEEYFFKGGEEIYDLKSHVWISFRFLKEGWFSNFSIAWEESVSELASKILSVLVENFYQKASSEIVREKDQVTRLLLEGEHPDNQIMFFARHVIQPFLILLEDKEYAKKFGLSRAASGFFHMVHLLREKNYLLSCEKKTEGW